MGRDRDGSTQGSAEAISIVGPGMTFVGNCETEGTIRVEGRLDGSIRAGRTVVIGPDGIVTGDVRARDATVAGTIKGTLIAESKIDLQETCRLDGEVYARTVRVGEGAVVNAAVHMGEDAVNKVTGGDTAKGPKLHDEELAAAVTA